MSPATLDQPLTVLFESRFGEPVDRVVSLRGDGSVRKLFRLSTASRTAIGVVNPDVRENRAFLEFSRHFHTCGLPVPEIYAEDLDRGMYLEEDLGDTTLFQFLTVNRAKAGLSSETLSLYRKVIELLPRFQIEAGRTLNYDVCYPRSSFDKQSMMWDLSYFKYYFLRLAKIPFSEQALENDFEWFTEFLLMAERRFFLYRDFQSRNIMIRDGVFCVHSYLNHKYGEGWLRPRLPSEHRMTYRVSLYFYNTLEECDVFLNTLHSVFEERSYI